MWPFSKVRKDFGVWVEKWDCRCAESWFANSTGVRQFGNRGHQKMVEKNRNLRWSGVEIILYWDGF